MSLHLTETAPTIGHNAPPANHIVRLPKAMLSVLKTYAESAALESSLRKQAEAAKKVADVAKTKIMAALDGATSGVCQEAMITASDVKEAAATITLNTGETVPFADVRLVVLTSNRTVEPQHIAKIYGGRSGYAKLTVAGKLD